MKILNSDLDTAVEKGIINSEQASKLWQHFDSLRRDQAQFHGLHVLYYFGGVLILASMSWFLTSAWSDGRAIMLISGIFAAMYLIVGHSLWKKENLKIPGGLLVTAAVGLTPVFIYGFQHAMGLWPESEPGAYQNYHIFVKASWFYMEVGTVIAALIALRFFQFTFITFPLALSLWYLSMDLTPLIFGNSDYNWDERKIVSCVFGFIVLGFSYYADKIFKKTDYAFWTYLYGMLAFWGGLSSMQSDSEFNKLIYCLLNILFIITSVYLRRKVFLVFGTVGVLAYVSHLAWQVFKDSYILPIALALAGISVVYLGVQYQKNQKRFEAAIEKSLPNFLMKWRPIERT